MKIIILLVVMSAVTFGVGLPKAKAPNLSPPQIKVPEPQATAPNPADHPAITTIKKRDKTITIKSAPSGPLYTVVDNKGKELAKDVNEADLAKKDPKLHEFVKSAVAGDPKAKAFLDASTNK